ncbi:hypothetical protein [Caballeronia mineralivorans]|uniref:hypothetical protein n=1 Tax=Caballeronia mineralivorans TaxID=2010198 RepID=UPI00136496A6|nr:hypothetical protein [Caballeronia mineralivorans]
MATRTFSAARSRIVKGASCLRKRIGNRIHLVHLEAGRDPDVWSRCYLKPRARLNSDSARSERDKRELLVGYRKPDAKCVSPRDGHAALSQCVRQRFSPFREACLQILRERGADLVRCRLCLADT